LAGKSGFEKISIFLIRENGQPMGSPSRKSGTPTISSSLKSPAKTRSHQELSFPLKETLTQTQGRNLEKLRGNTSQPMPL